MWKSVVLFAALAIFASPARAEDAASLLAQSKQASGGAAWDAKKTIHASGTVATGGLSGDITIVQDLATGRSSDQYKLGPVTGADGYDGKVGWTRDPGGEIAALDAPEAVRRAKSGAWLDAHAYWYPDRIKASYGA